MSRSSELRTDFHSGQGYDKLILAPGPLGQTEIEETMPNGQVLVWKSARRRKGMPSAEGMAMGPTWPGLVDCEVQTQSYPPQMRAWLQ